MSFYVTRWYTKVRWKWGGGRGLLQGNKSNAQIPLHTDSALTDYLISHCKKI